MTNERGLGRCPVAPYDRAGADYASRVAEWLAEPHAYFCAFGPEAKAFQATHRSPRLRTMTLVAPAGQLAELRPVGLCLDGLRERLDSWETAFATAAARLIAAHPLTFAALQSANELVWLGCPNGGAPVAEYLAEGKLRPVFAGLDDVVRRIQWLFLMCGIRLNEVIVQVDPYTDEAWKVRREELARKKEEERSKPAREQGTVAGKPKARGRGFAPKPRAFGKGPAKGGFGVRKNHSFRHDAR